MANVVPVFQEATRAKAKAAVLIEGLPGKGKSTLALWMAYILSGEDWGKVAAVDTENESLRLLRGAQLHTGEVIGPFMVGHLYSNDGFMPTNYQLYRNKAVEMGMTCMVMDSISHMWQYRGGVLDMVTRAQQDNSKLNKYTVWGQPEIMSEKNMIFELMRSPQIHQINTVRSKEKQEIVDGDDGKKKVQSLGEQQIAQPDLKYEPDLVLAMVTPGTPARSTGKPPVVRVIKSRYQIFTEQEEYNVTKELLLQLKQYLDEGVDPEVLLEQQRQEYVKEITEILNTNPSAKTVWPFLKEQHGHKDTKLTEIPLHTLKYLFGQLVAG